MPLVVVEVPVVLDNLLINLVEIRSLGLVVMAEHLLFQDLQYYMQVEVVAVLLVLVLDSGAVPVQAVGDLVGMMMDPKKLQLQEPTTKEVAAAVQDHMVATTLVRPEERELLLSDIEFHKIYNSSHQRVNGGIAL